MGIQVESVISLENGERYVVLDETNYYGTQYYMMMGMDPENDIIENDVAIFYVCEEGEDIYIDRVRDLELVVRLVRQFKRQDNGSRERNLDTSDQIEMKELDSGIERTVTSNEQELMDRIDAIVARLDEEEAEEDGEE